MRGKTRTPLFSKKDKGSHKYIVQSFLIVCAVLVLVFGKPAVAALQGTLSNNAQEQIADKFQIEYGNVNSDHVHDWQPMGNRMHYCFCGDFHYCTDDNSDEICDVCMGSLHVHTWVYNGNFTEQTHICHADNKVEFCLDSDADGYCDDCGEEIHEHDAVWVDDYSSSKYSVSKIKSAATSAGAESCEVKSLASSAITQVSFYIEFTY